MGVLIAADMEGSRASRTTAGCRRGSRCGRSPTRLNEAEPSFTKAAGSGGLDAVVLIGDAGDPHQGEALARFLRPPG
jgi:hypothetical protein